MLRGWHKLYFIIPQQLLIENVSLTTCNAQSILIQDGVAAGDKVILISCQFDKIWSNTDFTITKTEKLYQLRMSQSLSQNGGKMYQICRMSTNDGSERLLSRTRNPKLPRSADNASKLLCRRNFLFHSKTTSVAFTLPSSWREGWFRPCQRKFQSNLVSHSDTK